jgi:hypothetical protein
MAQPRYSDQLKRFIQQWRPNDPALDERFMSDIRGLVAAIVSPPASVFEVTTILSADGGKVVVRLGDYEAQLDPLDSQHLGLSLIEAATAARTESFLARFLKENVEVEDVQVAGLIGSFRDYRIEEMQRELAGDLERRSVPPATP